MNMEKFSENTIPPKIEIHQVNSPQDSEILKRLKNHETREPTEFEKHVINRATDFLNEYRRTYADKNPIAENTIKMTAVTDSEDLSTLLGVDTAEGHSIGGFITDIGKLYVSGKYDDIGVTHIIVHEMTHYFTGEVPRYILSQEDMEAATELTALEVLAKILDEYSGSLTFGEKIISGEQEIFSLLVEHYQAYKTEIAELQSSADYNPNEIKTLLFSGTDFVQWEA